MVTTTSDEYGTAFGFTEEEVFAAMDEYGFGERETIRNWYDGFVFGRWRDIYNPWSILNFLDTGRVSAYWANSSSNSLVGKLIREGTPDIKMTMEDLLQDKAFHVVIDEEIVFKQLDHKRSAVWSLLLASGYLRAERFFINERGKTEYDLKLTNREVHLMFEQMIDDWFLEYTPDYDAFVKALLQDDLKAMNAYMNQVALATFSYFDTGKNPSRLEPERFYHGFVLGLMVDLADRYVLTSNRESGFGRYDVMLEPGDVSRTETRMSCDAMIMEFKVQDEEEKELSDTVEAALVQIEQKGYEEALVGKGIPRKQIRKYGFAFYGKKVLIGRR